MISKLARTLDRLAAVPPTWGEVRELKLVKSLREVA
jgi:hypothetical protein